MRSHIYSYWSFLYNKLVLFAAFRIFVFVLDFQHFDYDVSGVDLFIFTLLDFIELLGCAEKCIWWSLGNVLPLFLHYFFFHFLSFFSGTSIMQIVLNLMLSYIYLKLCLFFLILFSLCSLHYIIFLNPSSTSLIYISTSSNLLLILLSKYFILITILWNSRIFIWFLKKKILSAYWYLLFDEMLFSCLF